mmetsp:Transcript_68527/g.178445  ORF Transcript_68527/g.178445 Transcript_68527/m.178445 type:complete len:201 (+) Transcript_68527:294-896(+)
MVDVVEHADVPPAGLHHHIEVLPPRLTDEQHAPHLRDLSVPAEDAVLQGRIPVHVGHRVQRPKLFVGDRRDDVIQLPEEAVISIRKLLRRWQAVNVVLHRLAQYVPEPRLVHARRLADAVQSRHQHDPGFRARRALGRGVRRLLPLAVPQYPLEHLAELRRSGPQEGRAEGCGGFPRLCPVLIRLVGGLLERRAESPPVQ